MKFSPSVVSATTSAAAKQSALQQLPLTWHFAGTEEEAHMVTRVGLKAGAVVRVLQTVTLSVRAAGNCHAAAQSLHTQRACFRPTEPSPVPAAPDSWL